MIISSWKSSIVIENKIDHNLFGKNINCHNISGKHVLKINNKFYAL